MGLVGNSPMSLLLILAIVLLVFGPGKLKHLGRDLGEALKQFRGAIKEEPKEEHEDK
ncbi:MAG: preprotein translocase subunit TatA [Legionellales bacterium RIFCSPHIGHO2_12_FULL_37_14]|nr:MAG: preprotein translocase subunit TatA [Legionellales bacterium RIFCSPHIGHO2_12_FULL_37_14]